MCVWGGGSIFIITRSFNSDGLDFRELLETCAFASFGGLPIQEVVENSPAARAQCQAWDVVVAVGLLFLLACQYFCFSLKQVE